MVLPTLKSKQKPEAFTIIEVVVVLAIAALIIVVVLYAVAGLQRSQREKTRQDAALRLIGAMLQFKAANNGTDLDDGAITSGAFTNYVINANLPHYNYIKICFGTQSSSHGVQIKTDNTLDYIDPNCGTSAAVLVDVPPLVEIWKVVPNYTCNSTHDDINWTLTPGRYVVLRFTENKTGTRSICSEG